jgi:hypothetical protein
LSIHISISRRLRWAGHVTCKGEMRETYKILVWNPKKRDHSGDLDTEGSNIKMDLKETCCDDVDWIHLAQVLLNKVRKTSCFSKYGEFLD